MSIRDKAVVEVIDNCFKRVLEDSSFLFADDSSKKEVIEKEEVDYFVSYISFNGEVNGDIIVLFSNITARELSMNMMGLEAEEIKDHIIPDSIAEFTNMFCGNIVFQIFGTDKNYDISIPVMNEGHEELFEKLIDDENTRYFMVDDEPVLLNVKY